MSPLHVGHCLTSSRTYFDSARLPKDKASFLFGPPARRSKGAGVDARRDRAGVGEKGSHAGRHTAPPELSSLGGAGSRWNCRKRYHCTGLQEAPRRTTESDGYRGRQQRALPQDSRTGPPPSSLGYPCEAAHSKPLTFVRVPMGQETGW